tara:strand:- start:2279 stop:2452 length:174 start_codon:yes stop_codon:yes gene_type:complete
MEYNLLGKKASMAGIFHILEKLNMRFPDGRSGLDDKIQFGETISFKLTTKDKTIKGS